MKKVFFILFSIVCIKSSGQCPNRINTNTNNIKDMVTLVENVCNVHLIADTLSSLNVYHYASADKVVTLGFELLKAKREAGDTTVNLPSKVTRIDMFAPAPAIDKLFADIEAQAKTCSYYKTRKSIIKYGDETAEVKKITKTKKQLTIY